jgi:hypothetical protein
VCVCVCVCVRVCDRNGKGREKGAGGDVCVCDPGTGKQVGHVVMVLQPGRYAIPTARAMCVSPFNVWHCVHLLDKHCTATHTFQTFDINPGQVEHNSVQQQGQVSPSRQQNKTTEATLDVNTSQSINQALGKTLQTKIQQGESVNLNVPELHLGVQSSTNKDGKLGLLAVTSLPNNQSNTRHVRQGDRRLQHSVSDRHPLHWHWDSRPISTNRTST